ncbi:MAG: hypothetical protein FWH08_05780 [Oscillospiraceae bacterium]|nr:hypothetical protein [Oscillospiraceae bacterium]
MKKIKPQSVALLIITAVLLLASCSFPINSAENPDGRITPQQKEIPSLESLALGEKELSCTIPAMLKSNPMTELPDGTFVIDGSFRIDSSGTTLNSYACKIIGVYEDMLIGVKIEEDRKGISVHSLNFDGSNQNEIFLFETIGTPVQMRPVFSCAVIYEDNLFLSFNEQRVSEFNGGLLTQEVLYKFSLAEKTATRLNTTDHYSNQVQNDSGCLLTIKAPVIFGGRIYAIVYENHEPVENRMPSRGVQTIISTDLDGNDIRTEWKYEPELFQITNAGIIPVNIEVENGDVIFYVLMYDRASYTFEIIRINLTSKEQKVLITYYESGWQVVSSAIWRPDTDVSGGAPSWSDGYIYFVAPFISEEYGEHSVFKINADSGEVELVREFGEDMQEFANDVYVYNGNILISTVADYGDGAIGKRHLIDKDGNSVIISSNPVY